RRAPHGRLRLLAERPGAAVLLRRAQQAVGLPALVLLPLVGADRLPRLGGARLDRHDPPLARPAHPARPRLAGPAARRDAPAGAHGPRARRSGRDRRRRPPHRGRAMTEPFSVLLPVYAGDRPDWLRRAFASITTEQTLSPDTEELVRAVPVGADL